jgi:hypothetical protein
MLLLWNQRKIRREKRSEGEIKGGYSQDLFRIRFLYYKCKPRRVKWNRIVMDDGLECK